MTTAGRRAAPSNVKRLHGVRASRIKTDEPMPREVEPEPPEWATEEWLAVWSWTCSELRSMGLLHAADREALVCLVTAVHEHDRPAKGQGPFEKVLSFLGAQANGGTQFDGVLTEALEKASKQFDAAGKGKADIVFITDGAAKLTEEWIAKFKAEKERVGVRLYSVYIGGASDMANKAGPVGLLNQFSDAVIPVADLKPQSVKHIFEKV